MKKHWLSHSIILLFLCSIILGGCSSSTDSANNSDGTTTTGNTDDDDGAALKGRFIDSPVSGLSYITSSGLSGVTDASGEFLYLIGDVITFSLGQLELGSVLAKEKLTPFDLVGFQLPSTNVKLSDLAAEIIKYETGNVNAFTAGVNMLIFLQSLDQNNNADDGIVLTQALALFFNTASVILNFDQNADDFFTEFFVLFTQLVATDILLRNSSDDPVDSDEALAHFVASAF